MWPVTATAFRFFDPMTAPTPQRAFARLRSLMMAAKRTRFSPAGPMPETRTFPWRSWRISSVSEVVFPQRSFAGCSSASPSATVR